MNAILLIAQVLGSMEVVEDECDHTARIRFLSIIKVSSHFILSTR